MVYSYSGQETHRNKRKTNVTNERKDCSLKTEQRVITASQILRDERKKR